MSVFSKVFFFLARQSELEYKRAVLLLLDQKTDSLLLDCGCGNGEFTLRVAERIGTDNIYGIDVVEEALDKARAKGIKAFRGDLNEKLPFENQSVDVVVANQVIEHLSNTDLFFGEIHRVLRAGQSPPTDAKWTELDNHLEQQSKIYDSGLGQIYNFGL